MPKTIKMSAEPASTTWTHERARVASLSRSRRDDDPELIDARRNLRAAKAEEYLRKLIEGAPPLSPEQTARLAVLLTPAAPGSAA